MPGYRSLPDTLTGAAAERARQSEACADAGDLEGAIVLLERALEESLTERPELPGWLCGRLAAYYRSARCYYDEILLLERYRDSQTVEEARTRYQARLTKAQTLYDRSRRTPNSALPSVRRAMAPRPRRNQGAEAGGTDLPVPRQVR